MRQFDNLYTKSNDGAIRFWRMEANGSKYRTVSGLYPNGKSVESAWRRAEGKNAGRSNATTDEEQALAEIKAQYEKKLERKYHERLEDLEDKKTGHKFFAPMLAKKFDDSFVMPESGVMVQPKLDGIRMIASKDGFFSRQGKEFNLPHIREALSDFFERHPSVILDGELYNHLLKDDFNSITSLVKREKRTREQENSLRELIQYHVYDSPMSLSFFKRHCELYDLISDLKDPIMMVETIKADSLVTIDETYERFLRDGYEGQIVRLDSPYENKRTSSLLKRKEFLDDEFAIVSIEEGKGNWEGYAKSVTCKLPDGRTFNSGIRGTREFTKNLLESKEDYNYVTVRYFTPTPDGVPRFPVTVDWHVSKKDY